MTAGGVRAGIPELICGDGVAIAVRQREERRGCDILIVARGKIRSCYHRRMIDWWRTCVQKNGNVVGVSIGDGEVQSAVPVQVGNGDRARAQPGRVLGLLLETAADIAQQNRNGVGVMVGYGEVRSAVPVQVANGDGTRVGAGRVVGVAEAATDAIT